MKKTYNLNDVSVSIGGVECEGITRDTYTTDVWPPLTLPELETLLDTLTELKKTPNLLLWWRGDYPICWYLKDFRHHHKYIRSLFAGWDKFSGNYWFPIPPIGKDKDNLITPLSPRRVFSRRRRWLGGYGKLRKQLVDWMIYKVSLDIEKAKRLDLVNEMFNKAEGKNYE